MANVFAILTAIVLALASFIAYKNKEAYQKEISATGNETHLKDAKNKANPRTSIPKPTRHSTRRINWAFIRDGWPG